MFLQSAFVGKACRTPTNWDMHYSIASLTTHTRYKIRKMFEKLFFWRFSDSHLDTVSSISFGIENSLIPICAITNINSSVSPWLISKTSKGILKSKTLS